MYGLHCVKIGGQWQKHHFPTEYEHFVNCSAVFFQFNENLLGSIEWFDSLSQYPLKFDRGYWDRLSNKKRGANNRKVIRTSSKACTE